MFALSATPTGQQALYANMFIKIRPFDGVAVA
jgi:hypothetical protein